MALSIKQILDEVEINVRRDNDTEMYSFDVMDSVKRLLGGCNIIDGNGIADDYTRELVREWIVLDPTLPGGSLSDYCASNALKVFENVRLKIKSEDIKDELIKRCNAENVLYPERELQILKDAGVI